MPIRVEVRVEGIVQGVGFRPFVCSLASRLGLVGFVLNDSQGVLLEVQGRGEDVSAFVLALERDAPPLAVVEAVICDEVSARADETGFRIVASVGGSGDTLVSPDMATCQDCLAETLQSTARRYRYPFTNCTNCGPRFTIITDVPYDRPSTTMAGFSMCDDCRREYQDPSDRRFHAQPIACPRCGPHIRLLRTSLRDTFKVSWDTLNVLV